MWAPPLIHRIWDYPARCWAYTVVCCLPCADKSVHVFTIICLYFWPLNRFGKSFQTCTMKVGLFVYRYPILKMFRYAKMGQFRPRTRRNVYVAVRPFVRSSIGAIRLLNKIIWKRMNRFAANWHKWPLGKMVKRSTLVVTRRRSLIFSPGRKHQSRFLKFRYKMR